VPSTRYIGSPSPGMCSFASLWSYGRLCVSRPLDQGYLPLLSPALPRPSIHPQVVQSFPLRAKVRTRVRVSDGAGRLINDSHQQNNRLISVSRTITQSPPRPRPVRSAPTGARDPHWRSFLWRVALQNPTALGKSKSTEDSRGDRNIAWDYLCEPSGAKRSPANTSLE
jgi:hypothetical protein